MTKPQFNKLSMLEAVAALLKLNIGLLSGFPILLTIKSELSAIIVKIHEAGKTVKTSTAGKTLTKDEAKENLIDLLLKFANSLYSWAKRNGIEEVKEVTDVSKSKLTKLRENELVLKASVVIDKLKEHKEKLTDYTITDEKINSLENALTDFNAAAEVKDTGTANRVAAHENLDQLFEEGMDLLEDELDGLMENFRETEIDFYNAYFAARVIKNLGGHKGNNNPPATPPSPTDPPPST